MARRLVVATLLASGVGALPSYLTGCSHPSSALGPHGAPVEDPDVSLALLDGSGASTASSYSPGQTYSLTVTAPVPGRALLTVSHGVLHDATLCQGRRLNWGAVLPSQTTSWTAPAGPPAGEVTLSVTFSSGAEYRQARLLLSAAPAAAPTPVPARSAMSGMAGMETAEPDAPYMPSLHVGVLSVDSTVSHAHSHGGGSWAGHMIPAVFFLIWGAYWSLSAISAVATAGASRTPFRPRAWYPLLPAVLPRSSRLRRFEPTLKILLPSLGAFCELYFHPPHPQWNGLLNADGSFNEGHVKFWQHAAMYGFFILSGFVDLFAARHLPPGAPHAVLCGAFAAEGFLFYFHLQSQAGMMAEIHLLLVLAIMLCAAATACEGLGGGANAALARAYFTLLQGGWFVQISHALYGRRPWEDSMATEMVLPVIFCLHLLAWAAALLALNGLWVTTVHEALVRTRGGALWQTAEAAAAGAPTNAAPGGAEKARDGGGVELGATEGQHSV